MNPTLEEVTAAFDHWRSNRSKQGRVPHDLAEQAVTLVGKHSKAEITKCLKINHSMLNKWLGLKPEARDFIALPATHHSSIDQFSSSPLKIKAQLSNGAQISITGTPEQAALFIAQLQQRRQL